MTDKFSLFKSTFGASNDVLGAIESGLDFEKKISDILNTCRTDDEISRRFEKLQEEFKSEIDTEQQAHGCGFLKGFILMCKIVFVAMTSKPKKPLRDLNDYLWA